MRQILLDTNVLISYLTNRDPEQQKKAEALFEQAVAVATFDIPLSRRLRRHGFKIYW